MRLPNATKFSTAFTKNLLSTSVQLPASEKSFVQVKVFFLGTIKHFRVPTNFRMRMTKNAHTAKMYEHFQQRGHSAADMRFIAIEVVQGRFKNDEDTLSARERVWIDRLQTITYGLNTYHTT